jgi:hypothetical protein
MTNPELDIRGAAIVGMALSQALLATLRAKKILTDDEADEIFENVLSGLEIHLPQDDPSAQQARHLVDLIARIASEVRLKRGK